MMMFKSCSWSIHAIGWCASSLNFERWLFIGNGSWSMHAIGQYTTSCIFEMLDRRWSWTCTLIRWCTPKSYFRIWFIFLLNESSDDILYPSILITSFVIIYASSDERSITHQSQQLLLWYFIQVVMRSLSPIKAHNILVGPLEMLLIDERSITHQGS